MTFSKEDLPNEPIFVYHVTLLENKASIQENGLQPNHITNTLNPSVPEKVTSAKKEIDDLLTQISQDSSSYPTVIRENCVYFWVNQETAVEKANSLLKVGKNPLIVGFKYEHSSNEKYLADMRLFTEAVDRYLHLKGYDEQTLRDYSNSNIDKETIMKYLIQYLEKTEQISRMEDIMNVLDLYTCPELLVNGTVSEENLYFFDND